MTCIDTPLRVVPWYDASNAALVQAWGIALAPVILLVVVCVVGISVLVLLWRSK